MKKRITITFKTGQTIITEPIMTDFAVWRLLNNLSFCTHTGVLYEQVENVILGKDISDKVKMIEISYIY